MITHAATVLRAVITVAAALGIDADDDSEDRETGNDEAAGEDEAAGRR